MSIMGTPQATTCFLCGSPKTVQETGETLSILCQVNAGLSQFCIDGGDHGNGGDLEGEGRMGTVSQCMECQLRVNLVLEQTVQVTQIERSVRRKQLELLEELRNLKEHLNALYEQLKAVDQLMKGAGNDENDQVEGGGLGVTFRRRVLRGLSFLGGFRTELGGKLGLQDDQVETGGDPLKIEPPENVQMEEDGDVDDVMWQPELEETETGEVDDFVPSNEDSEEEYIPKPTRSRRSNRSISKTDTKSKKGTSRKARPKQKIPWAKRKYERLQCPDCGKPTTRSFFNTHRKYHCTLVGDTTSSRVYTCPQCQKRFKCKGNLDSHQKIFHGSVVEPEPVICSICGKPCSCNAVRIIHEKSHMSAEERKREENSKPPEKPEVQEDGDGGTSDAAIDLEVETTSKLKKKPGPKPHGIPWKLKKLEKIQCPDCGKPTTRSFLPTHRKSYCRLAEGTAKRVYTCPQCQQQFKSKQTMTTHQQNLHGTIQELPAPMRLSCDVCGKPYRHITFLRLHEDTHKAPHERERKTCEFCGKVGLAKNTYPNHLRYCPAKFNPEERNFCCDKCGKGFTNRWNLMGHKRTVCPDVEQSWPCPVCGKEFKSKPRLHAHVSRTCSANANLMRKTTRDFICEKCGADYIHKKHLSRHSKTCDGNRPQRNR